MTNEQTIQLEEIIEDICDVTTDYEDLADEIADGDHPSLVDALVAFFNEDVPLGALTGDTMTTCEWIAERVAELD